MTTKLPGLPPIPSDASSSLKAYLKAVGEALEVRLGRRGDTLDRAVTLRELIDSGLAVQLKSAPFDPNYYNSASVGFESNTALDTSVPPAPTFLLASAAFETILLEWSNGAIQFGNYAFTEVFRNTLDVIGDAVLVATVRGALYADQVDSGSTYYYWVRHVSEADIRGPFNQSSGTEATTAFIDTDDLQDNLITSAKILEGAVDTLALANDAVTNAKIAVDAVQGDVIAASAITTTKISDDAITTAKIAANAVTASEIAAGTITASEIAAGTITAAKIATDTITAASGVIADAAILNANIADAAISSAKIADAAISSAKIVDAAIINAKIADATIDDAKISNLSAGKITTGTLSTSRLNLDNATITANASGQVQIASLGVNTAQIANAAITTAKIADANITNAKIGTAAVTAAKIQSLAVDSLRISNGAVSNVESYANTSTSYTTDSSYTLLATDTITVPNGGTGSTCTMLLIFDGITDADSFRRCYFSVNGSAQRSIGYTNIYYGSGVYNLVPIVYIVTGLSTSTTHTVNFYAQGAVDDGGGGYDNAAWTAKYMSIFAFVK